MTTAKKGGFQITLIVLVYYYFLIRILRVICVIVSHNKILVLVVYRKVREQVSSIVAFTPAM
jgi:hypothetical protein